MKKANTSTAMSPTALRRLDEIQQEMRVMCEPHYDEFHKMRIERGFATITIPKKRK